VYRSASFFRRSPLALGRWLPTFRAMAISSPLKNSRSRTIPRRMPAHVGAGVPANISMHRGLSPRSYDFTEAERVRYDTYGNRMVLAADGVTTRAASSYGQQIGFTGRYQDKETKLLYVRGRYFNFDRFLSRDRYGYHGRTRMNLYSAFFVPNKLDPSGWIDCPPAKDIARGIINGDTLRPLFPDPQKFGGPSDIFKDISDQATISTGNDLAIGLGTAIGAGIGYGAGKAVTIAGRSFIRNQAISRALRYGGAVAGAAAARAIMGEKKITSAEGKWGSLNYYVDLLPSETDCECCYLITFTKENVSTELTIKVCTKKGTKNPSYNPFADDNLFSGKIDEIKKYADSADQTGQNVPDYSHGNLDVSGSFDGPGVVPP
jgi:RHS repeat-associated protein